MEIIKQILDNIELYNNSLIKEIKELNNSNIETETEITNIKKFLTEYEKNNFNIEYLKELTNILNIKEIESITVTYETLKELLLLNNPFYETQLNKCQQIINEFINKIKNILAKKIDNYNKIKNILEEKSTMFNTYNKISKIITDETIIADENSIELLFDLIDKIKIDNSTKEKFIKNFIIKQTELTKNKLTQKKEIEKTKETKIEEAEEVEIKEIKETKIEETEEVEIKETKEIELINDKEYKETLKIAKELTKQVNTTNKIILTALKSIDEIYSFEERNIIYSSIDDLVNRENLILLDIKTNIIPKLEKDYNKETIILLKKILETYNNIHVKIKNNEKKDIFEKMQDLNMNKEIIICKEIREFLYNVYNMITKDIKNISEEKYETIFNLYQSLEKKIEQYLGFVEVYYNSTKNDEDKELLEEEFKELNTAYNLLKDNIDEKSIEPNEEIISAEEFYGKDPKNIYIFIEKNGIPLVVEDIAKNTSYLKDDYTSLLKTLKTNVNNDYKYKDKDADHKAKSDDYSDSFLTTYKVKNIKSGAKRISYSRFSTKISEGLPEFPNNPHIIFIYNYFYGNTDSKTKHKFEQEAIKRCCDNRNFIDQTINLFNTDWSKLSAKEKEETANKIRAIIKRNYEQLEYIIKKSKKPTIGGEH